MELISWGESPWEDHHHISSFLPNSNLVEPNFVSLITVDIFEHPQSPVLLQGIDSKGKLCNITHTILVEISMKPGTVEHIHIGHNCSEVEIEVYLTLFKEFQDVFS